AATAVSYGPQTLTPEQQEQARQNIQADHAYDTIADITSATVPSYANAIRTNGYYAAGDGGGALYKRVDSNPNVGPELQTNGNFSSDTGWIKAGAATISGGQLHLIGISGARQNIPNMSAGKVYRLQYRVSQEVVGGGG